MAVSAEQRARARRKRRGKRGIENKASQPEALPPIGEFRELGEKVNPEYRQEFIKIAAKLERYQENARRAKEKGEHVYFGFIKKLLAENAFDDEMIKEVVALGRKIAATREERAKLVIPPTPAKIKASRKEFGRELLALGNEIKSRPLLGEVLGEAILIDFETEAKKRARAGESVSEMPGVKGKKYNCYHSIIGASGLAADLAHLEIQNKIPRDQEGNKTSRFVWEQLRLSYFESTLKEGDNNFYEAEAHSTEGALLFKVKVAVSANQKPFELARVIIEYGAGKNVMLSISRLTGRACPYAAFIHDIRASLGISYDVVERTIYKALRKGYEEGFFKESNGHGELPKIRPEQLRETLLSLGATFTAEEEKVTWHLNGKIYTAAMIGDNWIRPKQLKILLYSLHVSLEDFIKNLPNGPRTAFKSAVGF